MSREFPTGYKVAADKFDEQKQSSKNFVQRFYLPNGKTGKVIFLTDKPVVVEEHSVRKVGRSGKAYFDRIVSPSTFGDEDPLKDAGSRTSTVAYYTVIDCTKYKDGKGKVHQYEKKLLGLKQQAFDVVKRRRARILEKSNKEQNLFGAVFEVTRGKDSKEPSTGIDWQYQEHVTKKKMLLLLREGAKGQDGEVTLDPFNYEEVLAPAELAVLTKLAKNLQSQQDEVEEEEDEEDEPKQFKKKKVKASAAEDEDEEDDEVFDEDEDDEEEEEDEE